MAETYLTPSFQNAAKPQAAAPQTNASAPAPDAPAQTGGEQYQTPTFKNAVAPPQTTGGQSQTTTSANTPDSGWGIDWNNPWYKGGPALKAPQSVQDFSDVAGNEAMAQNPANFAAARGRLGPVASSGADVVGNILSPTTLLNAVPVVGPELAGATHEGLKSYASGNNWKTIGEDTLGGGVAGLAGQGTAALAPKILPQLTSEGLKGGLTYAAHKLLGGYAGGDVFKEGAGLFGVYSGLNKAGEWAGEQAKNFASSPLTRQAIQNLILSGSSAARTAAGPWEQTMPGL